MAGAELDLTGTSWQVDSLGGDPVPVGLPVAFGTDGTVSGRAGVNSFRGWWALAGGVLTVGPLMMTKMAGPPERMALEARWVALLEHPCTLGRDGGRLTVESAGGTAVLSPGNPGAQTS